MERNLHIDYLRIVLSLLVITPHAQPLIDQQSFAGWSISNGMARVAVPCFFIISGYYSHLKLDNTQALKKYLLHILMVYAVWSLIYLPTYIHDIKPRSIITFICMGYYHLWFLPALIIGIGMLKLGKIFIKNDSILLSLGLVMYLIAYVMENRGLPYRAFCNGIFFGYPFIILGDYLRTKNMKEKASTSLLCIIFLFCLVTLLSESYLGYRAKMYHNVLLSLYAICPSIFLLVLKSPTKTIGNDYAGKLASGIYYIHILVLTTIVPLSASNNINKLPLIFAISILLSFFIIFVNKRLKIFL